MPVDADSSEANVRKRRRLVFAHSACQGAISRLDPDDRNELDLITRLQEVLELVEAEFDRLSPGLDL